jgi:PAS domain S-box-containing protein
MGYIRKKLILLVAVAVLPALAILLYSGLDQRRQAIEAARHEVLFLARNMSETQQGHLESVRQTLSVLAKIPEIRNLDAAASREIFRVVSEENPAYFNISAAHVNGEVFASGKPFVRTNLADRKHFREALAKKDLAIGEFLITRIGENTHGFAYAYPVLDNAGAALAVLTLIQGLGSFSDLFGVVSLPAGSFLSITDHQGIRLSYYPPRDKTNAIGRPIAPQAWEMVRGGQDSGVATVPGSDGALRIVAFQAVRLSPAESPYMYVWAGIPEAQVLQDANIILIKNLLFMLLSTMVAFAFSWRLGKKALVAPISNLVETARNFARGDLHLRSAVASSPGELGVLAEAFNTMAAFMEKGQEELRRSEAKYRDLFEHNADGLLVADLETRRFRHANPMICKMLGYSGEELLKLGVEDIHPAADLPHILATFEAIGRKELASSENIPCRRKDGTIFLADINATLLDFDGVPCLLGMFRDVTERQQKEQQLIEKNAELERFTYAVSHDLKSPVVTVKNFLGFLEKDLEAGDREKVGRDLEYMHRATDRMDQLLTDLLSLAKIGHVAAVREPIPFRQVVGEALLILSGPITEHSVQVQVADVPLILRGERSRLVDIWQNLIDNAIKYRLLHIPLVIEVDLEQTAAGPVFSVRDNGIGIDPCYHDKIFGLFDQLNPAVEGSGLGLALVKRIVELNKGQIWVESGGPGQGSRFCFTLPAAINKPGDEK